MTEPGHVHHLRDVHDLPFTITGPPGAHRVAMELPVHCADCDASCEQLIASLDDHDHHVTVEDGWLIAHLVMP